MDEKTARELVAEVLVLRNNGKWREEDNELVRSGAVLNSQVGGSDIRERAAELRAMAPGPMLLQSDTERGTGFAKDGTALPPLMALGAAGSEDLAYAWGHAIGLEGRRVGLDVTWSPVLDVNTNPDNPIINVRSFGEDATEVARLGAAVVRGFNDAGLHCAAKHWPGHGDVAVDSHIALAHLSCSRERLDAVEWLPYRAAAKAGLVSAMTGHLLVPSIDPDNCTTVSPDMIAILKNELGVTGPIFTDSLGMEGLRTTLDSTEAAWRAIVAGHDQVLVDYKRPPQESVEAVVAACMDGRVPEERLREAVAMIRALKQSRAALPPLPPDAEIAEEMIDVGQRIAEASVTGWNWKDTMPDLGSAPLVIICDDLKRCGIGIADEELEGSLAGLHPAAAVIQSALDCEAVVLDEVPPADKVEKVLAKAAKATGVVGITFSRISCYKGDGTRLPTAQLGLWQQLHQNQQLQAMMVFESPYALADLPAGLPAVVGYGGDAFTIDAAVKAFFGQIPCNGKLPVTVGS